MDFYNTFTCMYFCGVFSFTHIAFLSDASSKTFEAIYQTPRSCLRFRSLKNSHVELTIQISCWHGYGGFLKWWYPKMDGL